MKSNKTSEMRKERNPFKMSKKSQISKRSKISKRRNISNRSKKSKMS